VVVVVAGGEPPDPRVAGLVPAGAFVVAADSGADFALALGLTSDLVVGDLDSVSPEGLVAAERAGATVCAHPAEKDATDLELALTAAADRRPVGIVVLAGPGGRADHHLANVALLAMPALAVCPVTAWLGPARVTVVRDEAAFTGAPGSLLSLLPIGGDATGITTSGLRYPLHDETLPAGTSRGVSNELIGPSGHVALRTGVLLAVQPHALDTEAPA